MKQFLVAVLLISSIILNGQRTTSLTVKETEEAKDEFRTVDNRAFHTTKSGKSGLIRLGGRSFVFDVFDKNLEKIHSEEKDLEKKEVHVGELPFGDQIKMITVHSPDRKKRIVYCHVFNIETKRYKKTKLFETTVEKKQGLFNLKSKRLTNLAISNNGQFIAIATDNIRKNINAYTVRVFDAQTLKLHYKKAYRKHEKKFFVHNDIVVSDDGMVYTMGKLYKDGKRERKNGDANYQFVVNKMNGDINENLEVNIGEDHIKSLILTYQNENLLLHGFYSELSQGRIKGGCSIVIDADSFKVVEKKTTELPLQVFKDIYGDKRAKRKQKKELSKYYIDYVLSDSEDNVYLMAEQFYITTRMVGAGASATTQTVYHYDDILILMFDATGELKWGRSIFKVSTAPSYYPFLKDGELHVIFNTGKNLKEKKDGRTKASKGFFESTALYDYVYSKSGKVSTDKIQNNKGNSFYLSQYGYFDGKRFVMTSSRKRKRRFMILE